MTCRGQWQLKINKNINGIEREKVYISKMLKKIIHLFEKNGTCLLWNSVCPSVNIKVLRLALVYTVSKKVQVIDK